MEDKMMQIAAVFSKFPAGRYKEDGPFNGARFRDEFLIPAVKKAAAEHSKVVVLLDGVVAYSSSFLEEAFGGLARSNIMPPDLLRKSLEIRADDLAYRPAKQDAEHYLDDELRKMK
jgi:hypothetical protein